MRRTDLYRKINGDVKIFFDNDEDFYNHEYVRNKIIAIAKVADPEVAELYEEDTAEGYSLNELGFVLDRAQHIFGIEIFFEAGTASWIGWDGMDGRDPDDFYDDWDEILEFKRKNEEAEEEFMKTWPEEYWKMKQAYINGGK